MPLTTGTRLGPYEIVALLGAGGMGEVYRARDTRLNRDVALKVLPELFTADPDRYARFTREAQTLAALHHPHIAHVRRPGGTPGGGARAGHGAGGGRGSLGGDRARSDPAPRRARDGQADRR